MDNYEDKDIIKAGIVNDILNRKIYHKNKIYTLSKIEIYCDGSYNASSQIGAYASIIVYQYKYHQRILTFSYLVCGYGKDIDNNKAEMLAIYYAIKENVNPHKDIPITIYTDSKYCYDAFIKNGNDYNINPKYKRDLKIINNILQYLKQYDNINIVKIKDKEPKYHKICHYVSLYLSKSNKINNI